MSRSKKARRTSDFGVKKILGFLSVFSAIYLVAIGLFLIITGAEATDNEVHASFVFIGLAFMLMAGIVLFQTKK